MTRCEVCGEEVEIDAEGLPACPGERWHDVVRRCGELERRCAELEKRERSLLDEMNLLDAKISRLES